MATPLFDLARNINLDKSRVSNPFPIIFICGGKIPDTDGGVASTLRASLMALLRREAPDLMSRVVLAESASKWVGYGEHFKNLIDFEEHLAALASMILLILESPGAIAELGAFSFVDSMLRKLWVINDISFDEAPSFIRLGPIAKLENACPPDASRYFAYEWLAKNDDGTGRYVEELASTCSAKVLARILQPALLQTPQSESFQMASIGHRMLLAADLVCVGGPLIVSELVDLVRGCGIDNFELKDAQRYLFILEKLGLISVHRGGNYPFYVPLDSSSRILQYSHARRRSFDRDGFTMELRGVQKRSAASIHGDRAAIFAKYMGGVKK